MRPLLVVMLLFTACLSGCAGRGLSAHQCLAGDWFTVGERDGLAGLASTQVLAHQDACGKHGVVPSTAEYRRGWAAGIARFCTPDNGYAVGLSGRSYSGSCPIELEPAFRAAYEDGRVLHRARAEVARLESQLNAAETRRDAIDREITGAVVAQAQPDLTEQERLTLLETTQRLLEERDALDRQLPLIVAELEAAYRYLEQLEPSFADRR
ncbi:MAG: DUF2799 domain-containing protein [Pseudomonadota bacterium]